MTLIGKQIADSRVLILIQQMLKAGFTKLHEELRKEESCRRC